MSKQAWAHVLEREILSELAGHYTQDGGSETHKLATGARPAKILLFRRTREEVEQPRSRFVVVLEDCVSGCGDTREQALERATTRLRTQAIQATAQPMEDLSEAQIAIVGLAQELLCESYELRPASTPTVERRVIVGALTWSNNSPEVSRFGVTHPIPSVVFDSLGLTIGEERPWVIAGIDSDGKIVSLKLP